MYVVCSLSIFRAKLHVNSLYIICSLEQVKLSLDKCLMIIYLSLGKYQLLLFPLPCVTTIYSVIVTVSEPPKND